jgi:hypothetical protein
MLLYVTYQRVLVLSCPIIKRSNVLFNLFIYSIIYETVFFNMKFFVGI